MGTVQVFRTVAGSPVHCGIRLAPPPRLREKRRGQGRHPAAAVELLSHVEWRALLGVYFSCTGGTVWPRPRVAPASESAVRIASPWPRPRAWIRRRDRRAPPNPPPSTEAASSDADTSICYDIHGPYLLLGASPRPRRLAAAGVRRLLQQHCISSVALHAIVLLLRGAGDSRCSLRTAAVAHVRTYHLMPCGAAVIFTGAPGYAGTRLDDARSAVQVLR